MRLRWTRSDVPREEGSVSVFLVVAVIALLLASGLVVDGGRKLQALRRADAVAEEAARAAGQALQPAPSVRGMPPRLDAVSATAAGRAYLSSAGVAGTVVARGDVVEVTTSTSEPTVFLAVIGIHSVSATGSASARLARGLTQEVS